MILVDANILVYAVASTYAQHERARQWLDSRLNGGSRLGLPWPSLLAFLRLVTNPRVYDRPLSMRDASAQVAAWLECETAWIPLPTERHAAILAHLLRASGATGNLVPDAHLAALAIEHGLELASNDGDFARFPGLRWSNPLAG